MKNKKIKFNSSQPTQEMMTTWNIEIKKNRMARTALKAG